MGQMMRFLESCLLMWSGAFMLVLSNSTLYWQFLNPRYAWITMVAGGVLVVLGFAALYNRARTPRTDELLALTVAAGLALAAFVLPNPYFAEPVSRLDGPAAPMVTPARITVDGQEYVQINLAELLNMEGNNTMPQNARFSVRGQVLRTPSLDAAGFIAIHRLFVACCFADATAVGYLVQVDDPHVFTQGDWVRVTGPVERLQNGIPDPVLAQAVPQSAVQAGTGENGTAAPQPRPGHVVATVPGTSGSIAVQGVLSAIFSDVYMVRAEHVDPVPMPDIPFVFSIHQQEPYAY